MSNLYYLVEHHFANSICTGTISKEQALKIVDETIDYFYNDFIDNTKDYNFMDNFIENSRINFDKLETAKNILNNIQELNNKIKNVDFISEQYYIVDTLFEEEFNCEFRRLGQYFDKLNKDIISSLDFSENYKDVLEQYPYIMNYLVLNYTEYGSLDHTKYTEMGFLLENVCDKQTEYNNYVELVMKILDYFYNMFLDCDDYTLNELDFSEDNINIKDDIKKYKSTLDNVEKLNKKFLKLNINSDESYIIINLFIYKFGYNFRNIYGIYKNFYNNIVKSTHFYNNLKYYYEECPHIRINVEDFLKMFENKNITLSSVKYILNKYDVSPSIYNEVIISLYKLEDQNKAREIREYIKKWFRGY